MFEETANALRLRFPEKEFDAGTAAAQVAEILHNLGYKKLFMSKMPESRFGIDGFPFIATFCVRHRRICRSWRRIPAYMLNFPFPKRINISMATIF